MRRMRIAFLAPFGLRAKGTARARTLPLARALARRGHTVAVFIPPYDSPEDAGHKWRDEGVEVVNIALPPGPQSAPWHWLLAWQLYITAARWRPEVVHAFKPKGPSGLAAALWWTRRGGARPRLVVDSDDWEGFGGWNDNPATGYSIGQKRFFAWQEKYGLSHADAWTVTSHCLAERATSLGALPGNIQTLHNGVEAARVTGVLPTFDGQEGRNDVLLYTRFAGVRPDDVATIWRAARELEPGARLLVVGKGANGEERELAELPGVKVVGWLEPEQIRAAFGRAALAIAPWADTAANRARHSAKIVELMAAGVPLVAYRVGEMTVTPGEAGALVEPGDAAAFARAVVDLLRDPARRARMSGAGRGLVREGFTWDALVEVALSAYRGEPSESAKE
ncbi:MAG: glycosyltransferase family 4 protein [Anaerolineae bacterium]|jgi:glycosyltransferase involved in cell wall biosynthesis|nr:glycosyltransferase family 4 protein [Anaerolineae bacterium]